MSDTHNADIAATLNFDPLLAAEGMTGQSYKDDEATLLLGVGMAMEHNQRKDRLLRERADSHFSMDFEPACLLFTDLGFEEVYRETFDGYHKGETFVIMWHPDGLLATCESYGKHRNMAKVYYNYRHHSGGYPGGHLTSSGSMCGDVWIGDHDAREGIRHNLNAMRAEGRFLSKWVARPFLWLVNYGEKDGDCEAINAAKIARLPADVQRRIPPAKRGGDE